MKKGWILITALAVLAILGLSPQDAHAQASIIGQVVDTDDNPVGGAQVMLHQVVERGNRPYRAEAETNERGVFEFNRIPAGNYVVSARARGLGGVRAEVGVRDQQQARVRLQLEGRQGGGEREVANVNGIVVTPNGDPVAGAVVTLQPMERQRERQRMLRTRTGRDGRFTFENIPEGRYVVTAMVRGGGARERIEVAADRRNIVRLVLHRMERGGENERRDRGPRHERFF